MGTKRIGLARTQALIENLKRSLDLGGSDLKNQKSPILLIENGAAAAEVETTDSGKIIMIDASTASTNLTVTIPTPAGNMGLDYTFILIADSHSASEVLLDSQLTNGIKGMSIELAADMADGNAVVNISAQKLGFKDSAKIGSRIRLVSDGDFYFVVDAVSDLATITSFT